MSTPLDSSLFVDIADAIGLGNPAIVEKDYYVVQLLVLMASLQPEYHQVIFTGGTALAKSSIKTYRMSEDVDLKLAPTKSYHELTSSNARRNARKALKELIEEAINQSHCFSIESRPSIKSEYRYCCFEIRYPQEHRQAPCLRPFIKLELIESEPLISPESRPVQSMYSEILEQKVELPQFPCATPLETQAEKLISMLRRTASVARNAERNDDKTLIRHIYDTYQIQQTELTDIDELAALVAKAIQGDVAKYGRQHPQLIESPTDEFRYALRLLEETPIYAQRYAEYVEPMVYAELPASWDAAFKVFKSLATEVLSHIEENNQLDG